MIFLFVCLFGDDSLEKFQLSGREKVDLNMCMEQSGNEFRFFYTEWLKKQKSQDKLRDGMCTYCLCLCMYLCMFVFLGLERTEH